MWLVLKITLSPATAQVQTWKKQTRTAEAELETQDGSQCTLLKMTNASSAVLVNLEPEYLYKISAQKAVLQRAPSAGHFRPRNRVKITEFTFCHICLYNKMYDT